MDAGTPQAGAVCLPSLAALPPEAGRRAGVLSSPRAIKSVLAVPLGYGDSYQGFLRVCSVRGERRWTEENIALLKIVGEIITNALERKRAAERVLRLSRLYSILARINGLLVRTPPLEALCEQACRILADGGLFRMAWIGMVEGGTDAVKPVAHSGMDGDALTRLRISADGDVPEGRGPVGTAIREERHDICNDTEQDPRMTHWREAIAQYQHRSIAAFPLKVKGRVVGALAICDAEPYAFDEEAIALFDQLSGDLSFAIEVGGQARQLHLQSTALESAANAIVITDPDGVVSWVNAAFTKLTGYTAQEVMGKKTNLLRSGKHDAQFYQRLWSTIASGQVWRGEIINQRKDRSLYTEEMSITPVRGEHGAITHYVAIKQDITERKQADLRLAAISTLGYRLSAAQTARAAARVIVDVADQLLGWDACICDLVLPDRDNLMVTVLNADLIQGLRTECTPTPESTPPSPVASRAIKEGGQLILRGQPGDPGPSNKPFGDTRPPFRLPHVRSHPQRPQRDWGLVPPELHAQRLRPA